VVNGAGQPVPTTAQGTTNVAGTVNVGNMPNVNVANTPNVNVTNTPTVSVAAGATINVTNPPNSQNNATPLAVLEATQPYEDACNTVFSGSAGGSCSFHTVPAGKRLVIQEVDFSLQVDLGLRPLVIEVIDATGVGAIRHQFTATFMGTDTLDIPNSDHFSMHQETRLYAGQNVTPSCDVGVSNTANAAHFTCELSGFLVDVP
jgi:hypothetical protein